MRASAAQAYDFLELHRRQGAVLQFGGSDQWGNIINGVELARRVDGASLFGALISAPDATTAWPQRFDCNSTRVSELVHGS